MYYNPLDKFYKSKIGAVSSEDIVTCRVKGNFDSVLLLVEKDGDNICQSYNLIERDGYFETDLKLSEGLYFYYFKISNESYIGKGEDYNGVITNTPKKYQLTVYDKSYKVPKWLSGGIIYQIFPDRFYSFDKNKVVEKGKILHEDWSDTPIFMPNSEGQVLNNDFFGGDLKGIIEKLDYIKSLGVNAIYLNPIFKAYSNHRYDTGDYLKIDPMLGTEEDLKDLISLANDKGIKIILDGVFNHTGDDSLYFNRYDNYKEVGAYQSKDSKYYDWYKFINYPNKYDSWWGIKTLPAVDKDNQSYIDFITGENGVIEHYTKLGIGGWRLDVVDELPDHFVKKIRSATKRINEDAIVIGEVWEDASNKISYDVRREYFRGYELDSVMNYPLKNAIFEYVKTSNVKNLSFIVKEQLDHYPKAVLDSLMNLLSTHDTVRLLTAVGGKDMTGKTKSQMANVTIPEENFFDAIFRLKAATLLQYTLCGVPSIYYGDEAGMQGYVDPLNRRCYPWGNENQEIINWYKLLGNIRNSYDAFIDGEYEEIYASDGMFVFSRCGNKSQVMVALNLGNISHNLEFDGELKDLLSNATYKYSFEMKKHSLAVLVKNL